MSLTNQSKPIAENEILAEDSEILLTEDGENLITEKSIADFINTNKPE